MADDLLSQAEIDVLLGRGETVSGGELPDALLSALRPLMDAAARRCASELSSLLRRTVRMRLDRITATSAGGFLAAAGLPAHQTRLVVQPGGVVWPVEIRSDILFSLIDCMLGGGHEPAAVAPRPLTEIERRLAARVVRLLAESLQQAWASIESLSICDEEVGSGTPPSGDPSDMFAVVAFSLELASDRGVLSVAIPRKSLQPLLEPAASEPAIAGAEIVAVLAEAPVADGQPPELAVGDILATDEPATRPITVLRDGVPCYQARLGSQDGHKAIEIVEAAVEAPAEPSAERSADAAAAAPAQQRE